MSWQAIHEGKDCKQYQQQMLLDSMDENSRKTKIWMDVRNTNVSDLFNIKFILGFDWERRGSELSELSGVAAEEVGLWLGEVHLLQDWDMLGHQAAQMGT